VKVRWHRSLVARVYALAATSLLVLTIAQAVMFPLLRRRPPPPAYVATPPPPPPPFPLWPVAAVLGTTLVVMLGISWWVARGLSRPLRQLADATERFGRGDLAARARLARNDELGRLGEAFDQMAARINTLVAAHGTLLANVSHELRTPIARIHVALELAEEDPAGAHARIAGVSKDLAELERLVDDILTMTRLETGVRAAPLRMEPTAPAELAARAAAGWRDRHGDRALALDVALPLPEIACDPMLLRRVIDNLLDNAAKYSPAATPVTLHVRRGGGTVHFSIEDRGPGMTAEDLTHAFTPFWRSDASRTRGTGGVGLGLALARQIARAHGGDVELVSAPQRGTVATLSVPVS